jgi:hypothetical protein
MQAEGSTHRTAARHLAAADRITGPRRPRARPRSAAKAALGGRIGAARVAPSLLAVRDRHLARQAVVWGAMEA